MKFSKNASILPQTGNMATITTINVKKPNNFVIC